MSATFTQQKKLEIVAIGFKNNFDKVVYGQAETVVTPRFFETSFKAFTWLEEQAKGSSLPMAILFDYETLVTEDFGLIKTLRTKPELAAIPVIGIADCDAGLDTTKCLKLGIDDVYTRPISWRNLYRRVQFLNKYKASFIASDETEVEAVPNLVSTPKRIFDLVFACSVLLMLSPVLLLIALLIKMEGKGPIIYKSKRVGTGYQVFDFLKFRSMCVDADEKLKELAHLNQYAEGEGNGAFVKLTNDPRITRVGKFIRKTSLDELPQLFNVVRGEMSIVGNRPLPLYEAEEMVKDQWAKRFLAPAGLTGLWQVSPKGKDNISVEERVGLDIEYAETNTFWLDIKILSRTLPAMIQKES